ncbi:MAG: tyrosine-type recombinase/integrase, partial [Pyrinomonadaceae bacterium]
VLLDEEVAQITTKLQENPEYEEALFFFQLDLITGARVNELIRLKWEDASVRFGTAYLFSGTTGKDRTIRVPAAAKLIAKRKAANLGGQVKVLTKTPAYFRKIFGRISKQLNITYGQRKPGGWTIHDIRHTCLTNLALDGVPLHGIMEFAGHKDISETERYLKFMPEQIELAAKSTTRLAQLANAEPVTTRRSTIDATCPQCDHYFEVEVPLRGAHLSVVPKTGTNDQ